MIKRHTFDNGFRLVYQKSEQTIPLTAIHVFCNVGSAFEIDGIRGASHLVEHMCFKGTREHSKPHNLLMEYNKIGSYFNAYTEKRYTCYTITCDHDHTEHCITLIADMLLHSTFSKKEFNKEQHVVVEENIRTRDNNEYFLEKALDPQFFRGSSYENLIDSIDYHPSATYLKHGDIYQWYKWFYHPSNMICSVISNLSFATILDMIKKTEFTVTQLNSIAPLYLYPTCTLLPITDHIQYIKKKGLALTMISFGFRTCSVYSEDKYSIFLLTSILNGFSGRLFTAFRTKRGLTYHSSISTTYHEHTGYMNFSIQTDTTKLLTDRGNPGVLPILTDLISDLLQHGITQKEFKVAQGNAKGKLLLEIQSMDAIAKHNGEQEMYHNKPIALQQIYEKHVSHVTLHDVNRIIRKYMTYDNMVVGFMSQDELPRNKIEKICSEIKWK